MPLSDTPHDRIGWLLTIAVFALVFYSYQIQTPLARSTHNDFKHLYLGSRLLWEGKSPYPEENLREAAAQIRHPDLRYLNPYVYPPFTGYFFGWLGKLEYESATRVWFWFNQGCLLLSMMLLSGSLVGFTPLARGAFLLGSLAFSFPLYRSTDAGQLNHFLLLLLSLIVWLWRGRWKKTAGAVIAFAALIKVVPAFLGIWLLWKREWGAFGAAAAAGLFLILLPGVFFGLTPYFEYLPIAAQMGYGSSTWAEQGNAFYVDPGNIGFPALVYRLFHENPRTDWLIHLGFLAKLICWLWALAVLAGCLLCCRVRRKDEDPEMELGVWILGMLLIPSLFWDHYLVLTLPAWTVLASRLAAGGVNDPVLAVAVGAWAVGCLRMDWANPVYLSGWSMLALNLHLLCPLILFLLSMGMAASSRMPESPTRIQL